MFILYKYKINKKTKQQKRRGRGRKRQTRKWRGGSQIRETDLLPKYVIFIPNTSQMIQIKDISRTGIKYLQKVGNDCQEKQESMNVFLQKINDSGYNWKMGGFQKESIC